MLFSLFLIGVLAVGVILSLTDDSTKEAFSYKRCINRGFSSSFCLATPIAGATSDICRCHDGSTGVTMYGTGARCMCGKELTDEWLQSRDPLVYDGSQYDGGADSDESGSTPPRNDADIIEDLDKKGKINKGRWWYKIEWI